MVTIRIFKNRFYHSIPETLLQRSKNFQKFRIFLRTLNSQATLIVSQLYFEHHFENPLKIWPVDINWIWVRLLFKISFRFFFKIKENVCRFNSVRISENFHSHAFAWHHWDQEIVTVKLDSRCLNKLMTNISHQIIGLYWILNINWCRNPYSLILVNFYGFQFLFANIF